MAKVRTYSIDQILNTFPNKKVEILNTEHISSIQFVCSTAFVKYEKYWLKCEATREGNWNVLSSKSCFPIIEKQEVILVPQNCKLKK